MINPTSKNLSPPLPALHARDDSLVQLALSRLLPFITCQLPQRITLMSCAKGLFACFLYYQSLCAFALYILLHCIDLNPPTSTAALASKCQEAASSPQSLLDIAKSHPEAPLHVLNAAAPKLLADDTFLKDLIKASSTITVPFATTLLQKVASEERQKTLGCSLLLQQDKSHADVLHAIITAVPSLAYTATRLYPLITMHPQHRHLYARSPEMCSQFIKDALLNNNEDDRERHLNAVRSIHPTHPLFNDPEKILHFLTTFTNPQTIPDLWTVEELQHNALSLVRCLPYALQSNAAFFKKLTPILGSQVNDLHATPLESINFDN